MSLDHVFQVDENRIADDPRCSLCGALFFGEEPDHHENGDRGEFVRWFADLEERDFVAAMIILVFIRNPHVSYAEISRYLTQKFGTIFKITPDVVSSRIRALVKKWPNLETMLGRKRKNVIKHKKYSRRVSYGGDER